jgi:DNA-binding transcriptional MerR regulator
VSDLVTTAEAAKLAGVTSAVVRMWRYRGLLLAAERRGRRPMYRPLDVLLAERATRTGVLAHYDDLPLRSAATGGVCP